MPAVSARLAQRAHGQSLAHRRLDLAARDADVGERSVVELVELANGAAQASTRGQVVQDPGAAHRDDAEPLGERMQSAAQAGLDDEGALDAGPPLAFDERRQREGVDSLGQCPPPARQSAPTGRARPQSGSKLLSTRAVQSTARQPVGSICSRDRNERLEANPEFPWRFSGDFGSGQRWRRRLAVLCAILRSAKSLPGPRIQFRGAGNSRFFSMVSGISSQTSTTPKPPMAASPRKALLLPSRSLIHPPRVVLTEAPMPMPVPTIPCARLKRPVLRAMSAIVSGTSTPNTAAEMPSSTCTATSQ